MSSSIGFIGAGTMAEALIGGLIDSGLAAPDRIMASDISSQRRDQLNKRYGVAVSEDNKAVVAFAPTVVLAIKPQDAPDVLETIGQRLTEDHLVVSIMAGVTTGSIEGLCPGRPRVVRVMPNVACLVRAGASAVARGTGATDDDERRVLELLQTVGQAISVDEDLLDAVTGLSGSGPAFVMTVIESMADGGVAEGLPRPEALALAAQTVLGAAKLLLETGDHPAQVRDRVISPGGTTAEGLAALEAHGVRHALRQAVRAATARSRELGKGT